MMHDREKSDSAIVAAKPTNKAGANAAEPVEPRAGAKGNASQQSTHRAQDWESVSQALERVRQAARQRKKERFTALLHHINIASLRMAFFALKRDAAPGHFRGSIARPMRSPVNASPTSSWTPAHELGADVVHYSFIVGTRTPYSLPVSRRTDTRPRAVCCGRFPHLPCRASSRRLGNEDCHHMPGSRAREW